MDRQGTATLPLHSGSAPRWLFDRMVDLGGAVAELVVEEHGRDELLRRLADPYWFQALGCALGFDWHSSGVTTTTMGALKVALSLQGHGVFVAGGKGAASRRTPAELRAAEPLTSSTRQKLTRASRLSATVDDACVQDSYSIYHHSMVVTEDGEWCVVQQGMDGVEGTARRYHWLSDGVREFVVEPQSAICAQESGNGVLDMTAHASAEARAVSVDIVQDDPSRLKQYLRPAGQRTLDTFGGSSPGPTIDVEADPADPGLEMPARHELRRNDLSERAVDRLQRAYEVQPNNYEELVDVEGIGPASLRALALVAELVYDAETSRKDPAKYAYAHGGKDGTPHPVDRERYDRSIEHLREALEGADVERETKQESLKRLASMG